MSILYSLLGIFSMTVSAVDKIRSVNVQFLKKRVQDRGPSWNFPYVSQCQLLLSGEEYTLQKCCSEVMQGFIPIEVTHFNGTDGGYCRK
jgi:hypothetical protein